MKKRSSLGIAVLALTTLALSACGGAVSDEYVREEPYSLEPIGRDEDTARVILTESAVERLGIETVPVASSGSRLVVPYDAVFIDSHGEFWVYTNPKPLAFVRAPIVIVRETSSQAILSDGPPVGTQVVTVGVPELYGSETEFGT